MGVQCLRVYELHLKWWSGSHCPYC
jgi:hypothetical protein